MVHGDVCWAEIEDPSASSGYACPYVIIQNDLFNRSKINTVAVCALTTNLRRAENPGNVLLAPGEANLPEQSVVNVSQIFTVNKLRLRDKVGTLSPERVREIFRGLNLLLEPRYSPAQ
ncbi:MAG: type II toxin-antitoxin system PemK/MazF family toxin [Rubrobacter sp.]|nr:type II toxin-antitoxin system PemK/MazF family toxin [Rubrobacter sp.]